ncbi:hypothetical protein DRH29_05610 [candidate division Kazan bacterium]|uniref:HDOD domain-containing protein n=1 Tax=candidate division Kazan bacterium TaxID=2202143 RepID=A0A420ZB05_UNCK3|nr:MAG: hypothetical protein DRH29_05610 [candidate division Kazan bacterium]
MSKLAELNTFIDQMHSLSAMPATINKVLELVNNPESSLKEISRVIEKDFELSSKVLKIVNSSYYGFKEKISSIQMAVVALGINTLRSMATGISFLNAIGHALEEVINLQKFWEHSMATAVIAGMAVKNIKPDFKEDIFVSGLLHDIGKVVLLQWVGRLYKKTEEKSKLENKPLFMCEKELIGVNHAEAGSLLAKKWHFPEEIIFTIEFHHQKDIFHLNRKEKKNIYANAVYFANQVALEKEIGQSGDFYREILPDELLDYLRLKPFDVVEIFKTSDSYIRHLKKTI